MELESQVCSLEYARRLDELGIKKKSIFVWEYLSDQCYGVKFTPYAVVPNEIYKIFHAYTVAELGEMLPRRITLTDHPIHKEPFNSFIIEMHKSILHVKDDIYLDHYFINYRCDSSYIRLNNLAQFAPLLERATYDENEANARAKMLIYLIENNLYKIGGEN